jgi:glycosyltransferase involved in cell wall biosynthesis
VRVKLVKNDEEGSARRVLDRAKWHQPLCTIIVTHRNYSHLVEDALLSVFDQTYENWECVVVDDFSREGDRRRLQAIVEGLSDHRIRFIQNPRQLGQIETFFAGLAESSGEFVSPLDPDDRLHPAYLEGMVRVHLNETVYSPIANCEQNLLRTDGALVTGTYRGGVRTKDRPPNRDAPLLIDITTPQDGPVLYLPCKERGWLWTSTSAMMVRRLATNLLIPHKRFGYNVALDAYLAFGAHFLGGTLLVRKPLVYRGLHASNDFISENIFSMAQITARYDAVEHFTACKRDAVEAMFHNGVTRLFPESHLAGLLRRHFDEEQMAMIGKGCPEALKFWRSHRPTLKRKRIRRGFIGGLWRRLVRRRKHP